VQKDVELLRNRVKMLQTEENRALKKISDTKNKAKQILDLKNTNDYKYAK
jgi:transcription elongation GreA/GreB family factor